MMPARLSSMDSREEETTGAMRMGDGERNGVREGTVMIIHRDESDTRISEDANEVDEDRGERDRTPCVVMNDDDDSGDGRATKNDTGMKRTGKRSSN